MSLVEKPIRRLSKGLGNLRDLSFGKGKGELSNDLSFHEKERGIRVFRAIERKLGLTLTPSRRNEIRKLAVILYGRGVRLPKATLYFVIAGLLECVKLGVDGTYEIYKGITHEKK